MSDTTRKQLPFLASLEGRDDPESRRVLLRVATDRFVNDSAPSREAITLYAKTAAPLIAACNAATRLIVARKLAARGDAPPAILAAIVDSDGDAALWVLERAVAAPRDLLVAAATGEAARACAIAKRADLDDGLIGLLVARPIPEVALALACNAAAPIGAEIFALLARRARSDKLLAHALLTRAAAPIDQASLFLYATSAQRAAILLAAQRAELARSAAPLAWRAPSDSAEKLERHALARQPDLFVTVLAKALDCEADLAERIAAEPSGEPLAVALAALDAPEDSAMRILLLGDSPVNLDYRRLGALTRLKGALHPAAARRVIAAMAGRAPEPRAFAQPMLDPTASPTPSRAAPAAAAKPREAEAPHVLRRRRALQLSINGRIARES